jgi:hypothetical protein
VPRLKSFRRSCANGASRYAPPPLMASILPSRPRQIGPRRTIAIVSSTYHEEFANGLLDHAKQELEADCRGDGSYRVRSPGGF